MKKTLTILLAISLVFSLFSACGSDTPSTSTSDKDFATATVNSDGSPSSTSNILDSSELNQTITSTEFKFTLRDVAYGTNLCNFPQRDNYLYPFSEEEAAEASEDKAYKAEEGMGYVILVYDLENISDENIMYKGNTALRYKGEIYEEYPYSNTRFYIKSEDGFDNYLEYEFKPSDKYEIRAVYEVPYEILENEFESLEVIATFDKDYTIKVR